MEPLGVVGMYYHEFRSNPGKPRQYGESEGGVPITSVIISWLKRCDSRGSPVELESAKGPRPTDISGLVVGAKTDNEEGIPTICSFLSYLFNKHLG